MSDGDLAMMVGVMLGAYAFGFAAGRSIKTIRQFFDQL